MLGREHGGVDALGPVAFDFSSNSNACGPCPSALAAVQQADATRYPDPTYADLRTRLAHFHGVALERVVLAASASEFIFRMTSGVARARSTLQTAAVYVPTHAYGDYTHAAQAWGLAITPHLHMADLIWCCNPSSPLGQHAELAAPQSTQPAGIAVMDCAYAALCLEGAGHFDHLQSTHAWHLFSPNKALGLTGVRGAYAIAPAGQADRAAALDALAPSWPLGAQGVALLQAWAQPAVQGWVAQSLHTLRQWKAMQIEMLTAMRWTCLPSVTSYFCATPPPAIDVGHLLRHLRRQGIKLRDAASFGLPGHVRMSVQAPMAQQALHHALHGPFHF